MSKDTGFRIVALFLVLLGLLVLWQSTVWGLNAVPGIITQLRSISGDVQNQVVYESPAAALRITGAILFAIGLWRLTGLQRKDGNGL